TSFATSRLLTAAPAKSRRLLRKRPRLSASEGRLLATDWPSVSTTWQPVLSCGVVVAKVTASENAGPLAIMVAEVISPHQLDVAIARFTPEVSPKSSALMMRRRTERE